MIFFKGNKKVIHKLKPVMKLWIKIVWFICLLSSCNSKREPVFTNQRDKTIDCKNPTGFHFNFLDSLTKIEVKALPADNSRVKKVYSQIENEFFSSRENFVNTIKKFVKHDLLNPPLILLEFWNEEPRPIKEFSIYKYDYSAFIVYQDCNYSLTAFWGSFDIRNDEFFFVQIPLPITMNDYCHFLLKSGLEFSHYFDRNESSFEDGKEISGLFFISKMGRYKEHFSRIIPNPEYNLGKMKEKISQANDINEISTKLKAMENIELMFNILKCQAQITAERTE